MPATVLVVDDSQTIHDLLALRLRPEGYVLQHALTASEGLAKAYSLVPDLILLDIDMPHISGFDACEQLKADSRTAALPIIFLTGKGDVSTKVRGFDLGAADYVTKPFEVAELRARVRAALRTKRYQDLLAARAHIDALTGLYNRAYFDRRLGEETAAVKRYSRRLSLVMVDIDHFKRLNDDFGHPFGDQVLQDIGDMISTVVRATDAPCRYGGDEFALILSETTIDAAAALAERLRAQIGMLEFGPRNVPVSITASLGVASMESLADTSDVVSRVLIEKADKALYEAKRGGRDQVCAATQR